MLSRLIVIQIQEVIAPPGSYKTENSFAISHESGLDFSQVIRSIYEGGILRSNVRVDGEIHIKPATEEASNFDLRVDVVTYSSDPKLVHFEYNQAPDAFLTMISPSGVPTDHADRDGPGHFVHAQVTIWVRPGVILPKLKVGTHSFSITLDPGLQFRVEGQMELESTHGFIKSRTSEPSTSIEAREIIIQTASGSVKGAYPLYDRLSISTQSGSIDIDLDLQEDFEAAPKHAELLIKTLSGSVHIHTPLLASPSAKIPLRDYYSKISSQSGQVDITIPHGSSTKLYSQSGSLAAALHPCGDPEKMSDLFSGVASGSARITVHPSRTHPTSPLRNFYASHNQQSGSLDLHYPAQWEGLILGHTISGNMRIDWPGVKIISDDTSYWTERRIRATKGEGEGKLLFSTASGEARLWG